jgi:hypothetical protein
MNKIPAVLALLTAAAFALYAEAPELRNVMPNSWRKLTRLSANEEAAFIQDNMPILDTMFDITTEEISFSEFTRETLAGQDARVYAEQAGRDRFYRIIIAESNPAHYDRWNEKFLQGLVYNLNGENTLLAFNMYNTVVESLTGYGRSYTGIDIVPGEGRAKAVTLSYVYSIWTGEESREYSAVKGQPCGKTILYYYRMEDFTAGMRFIGGGRQHKGIFGPYIPDITIEASECLIDGNVPLRYGIQSAFDGDPATSYVENTEDDLMEISVMMMTLYRISEARLKRITIINGYAQNSTLYNANNRVKNITLLWPAADIPGMATQEITLSDDKLATQIIDSAMPALPAGKVYFDMKVANIYPGIQYNDTCIAELDFELLPYGWLFGGADE